MTGEPRRRLARNARWVWRADQAFAWSVVLAATIVASRLLDFSPAFALLPLIGLAVGVSVVPELRWRRWRWDVRPDAIEIRHGTLTVRHTLVPMLRVQHVETTSDIVEQQLDLANVVVHTAAGSHKIPLLTLGDAAELRDRIAALAGTADGP